MKSIIPIGRVFISPPDESPKRGRPPLNGVRAMTRAEQNIRYHGRKNAGKPRKADQVPRELLGLVPGPLTAQISSKDSFVRRFIDDSFPDLGAISRACNKTLKDQGLVELKSVHEHRAVTMLVGTAIDFRVRAYFNRHIFETGAVMRGLTLLRSCKEFKKPYIEPGRDSNIEVVGDDFYWEHFEIIENPWYWRRRKRVAERLISSFRSFVANVRPERRRLTPEAEERMGRYCILFAYLDWIGRSPIGSSAFERMVRLGSPKVGNMLRAVDASVVADLVSLSIKFYKQQRGLLKKFKKVVIGGNFAGSEDVGGADFDMLVDGCLVDFKATQKPKITTKDLRQLVGYWLLDFDDAFKIRSVAIILLRHGYTQEFEIERDLLTADIQSTGLRMNFRNELRRLTAERSERSPDGAQRNPGA
jgi:hypothetical protein